MTGPPAVLTYTRSLANSHVAADDALFVLLQRQWTYVDGPTKRRVLG